MSASVLALDGIEDTLKLPVKTIFKAYPLTVVVASISRLVGEPEMVQALSGMVWLGEMKLKIPKP